MERETVDALQEQYDKATLQMLNAETEKDYRVAAEMFSVISGYQDADLRQYECLKYAKEKKHHQETKILFLKKKKTIMFFSIITVLIIIIGIFVAVFSVNESKYTAANKYMEQNDYAKAADIFNDILNYKDSNELYLKAKHMRDGNYAYVIRKEYLTEFTVPYGVTKIADNAFLNCGDLKKVILPDTIKSIGNFAFARCTRLTEIIIPENVTSIGNDSFSSCRSLTNINIPDSVTSIGEMAFWYCDSLKSITIPENVLTIGAAAFRYCYALEDICFNAISMEDPLGGFFEAGTEEIGITVTIGNKVMRVPNIFFQGENIKTVIFEENSICHTIGDVAFSGCRNLEKIYIPNSVKSIGSGAFADCINLKQVIIPNSVTLMDWQTFKGCKSLLNVTLSNKLSTIEYGTFSGCSSLKSINIPDSVTIIEEYAFNECEALESVTFETFECWYVSAHWHTEMLDKNELMNPSTAAAYIKEFSTCSWVRS